MHKFSWQSPCCRYRFPPVPSPSSQRSGTPEEQKACSRDVQRYCRPVIDQGDFTILRLPSAKSPKLTEACDQVLKNHGQ